MRYVTLGRTGLKVSVAGLGCGGHSRLGQRTGKTKDESVRLVRHALELGINVIDTAEVYGTETIVGEALQNVARDEVVLSTKKLCPDAQVGDPAKELREGIEASLKRIGTDYVDVFYLHGVREEQYHSACDQLLPVLEEMRQEGKVRFIGVTEAFIRDPQHAMAATAVSHDHWDVMMIGFNMLNQSARKRVFPATLSKHIGTMGMFAVRKALSRPAHLDKLLNELTEAGQVESNVVKAEERLSFLTEDGKSATIPEAAYRYCRHEPGLDVILTGTGSIEHLEENVASLLKGPLDVDDTARLRDMFGMVDSVSGN